VIVTFTTDFGTRDGYVGAMKGVVSSLAPGAALVDITHDVAPQDVLGGALALAQAAPFFPPGTVHVAVVDPGVGGARADVAVAAGGHVFLGPDNGLLSLAAAPSRQVFRIAGDAFRAARVSPTFHGRDVFAVAAGRIAAGAAVAEVGPPLPDLGALPFPEARAVGAIVEGEVVHVDRFGNLVTSVPAAMAEEAEGAAVVDAAGGAVEVARGRTYADVAPGALVAYVGSSGRLEIGLRDGSAAEQLRVDRGAVVRLRRRAPAT
jgi:S-adenosylmethionine hydrolase